jgi:hypothetical protein
MKIKITIYAEVGNHQEASDLIDDMNGQYSDIKQIEYSEYQETW